MKKILFATLVLLALVAFTGAQKQFEGIITYSVKVESVDPVIQTSAFAKLTGTELKIYVKGASIRAVCNGTSGSSGLLVVNAGDKKSSSLTLGNDAAALFLKENTLFAVKQNKTEQILNHSCKVLSCDVKSDYSDSYVRKDYYLCEDLVMDASPFKGNPSTLSVYKALENGHLPLKMVFEGAAYKVTYTAVSVEEKSLHDTQMNPDQN
ncbi:MAG: hypothetical protein IT233_04150 [Bacteroidia bacterium]|nr:hypothetical protein [Bacteroidia bacterium]